MKNSNVLGIDIGSVSVGVAEVSRNGEIVRTDYRFHHGEVSDVLSSMLENVSFSRISGVAATTSTPANIKADSRIDNLVAVIAATRHFHENAGKVLIAGGEKFGLVSFDPQGNYQNYKGNTSCAAGTGSFLDQQAGRLSLGGIGELSDIAFNNTGDIPKIASRCAVFAKTDLIHAQQEGYSLDEISDGLCHGLARNIVDTLFSGDVSDSPVVFCGGVALNRAVAGHISDLIGRDLVVDEMCHLYGAVGAALDLLGRDEEIPSAVSGPGELIGPEVSEKSYHHPPLELELSDYPDFTSYESYLFTTAGGRFACTVEVDIYENPESLVAGDFFLGIDIGSTSTKAVLLTGDGAVAAGFYTRTAGRPREAVFAVFEAIDDIEKKKNLVFHIKGAGTTGSGRKFIGKIIGADIMLDEITAHARAAVELNPDVDTIIEIGGQDAKFTTLKNGMVTSSVMNNVCAAGTGSFIEEQAKKLGCDVADYAKRTAGRQAPLSSDRCTVFMERDINHCLREGYAVDEVLASALHSVRENYLIKVATESNIGNVVFFQGATAKNKSLVAAFEQRLRKPILVSKYCHLTGAMGTALTIRDEETGKTGFRGISLFRKEIPIRSEVCELCSNHCKLTVADVDGKSVAYGFLCGRDYDTRNFVNNNTSGFTLLKDRKKTFDFKQSPVDGGITIGIPAALHLVDDLFMWKKFFNLLGINTVTSENFRDAVKSGKKVTGAEFCAPVTAMHGHAEYLMDRADYIFIPFYLENKSGEKGVRRNYCYYTQFTPSLVSSLETEGRAKFLTPVIRYLYTSFNTRIQLYKMLKKITGDRHISFFDVSSAYEKAVSFQEKRKKRLKETFAREFAKSGDISVALLGRPYTVLSAGENKKIPEIFASLGIKAFFQDMLPDEGSDESPVQPLLNELHWQYASEIIKAAETVAKTEGLYPVFMTSFKCSPDSFITTYFKQIMESHGKPCLILELDEHDSSVGYETRIEAAIRSFRNHAEKGGGRRIADFDHINPDFSSTLSGKTVVFPNWDPLTCRLLKAVLKREGFDVILMNETEGTIRRSLKFNTGQCIPMNAIAQGFIETVEDNNLDPSRCVLWMMHSEIGCNIKMYPHHIKTLFRMHGNGMENAGVYVGEISLSEVSMHAAVNSYFAYMFGGLLRRMGCRIRPYETRKGLTDRVIEQGMEIFTDALLGVKSREAAVEEVVRRFRAIPVRFEKRPKVAIFGDLYVRDNDVMNQDLIRYVEDSGGEVITTPYLYYAKMIAGSYFKKWLNEGKYMTVLSYRALLTAMSLFENKYYRYFDSILGDGELAYDDSAEEILAKYNVKLENTGESMDNILKVHYLRKHHKDLALFVQTNPAFCCASLVTEAMAARIEANTGVPVVSITYDGTGGEKNTSVIPYLKYPRVKNPELDEYYCSAG